MIQAVLWDFGGVFTPSPFHACRSYADALGIAHEVLLEVAFGPYHEDTDHPWHRLERGEGTLADALAHAVADAQARGFAFDPGEFFGTMRDDGIDRTIVVDKVRELRQRGLRNAIVTNNAKEFADAWRAMLPVDDLFDLVVDSSQVGMRKPNPAIYRHTLELLGGVAPGRAVFLDDFEPNVAAARALGMHGIVVHDPAVAMAELDALIS
ncbi:MAG TPA: HAD family phosphatase [Acidimicrobiales bacterium]